MPTVLIADSFPVQRIGLAALVREFGIARNVLSAASGEEALALAAAFRPLYLITSVRLSDMDAWTLVERLHGADRTARACLMTPCPEIHRLAAAQFGIERCLDQAATPAQIGQLLRSWLPPKSRIGANPWGTPPLRGVRGPRAINRASGAAAR